MAEFKNFHFETTLTPDKYLQLYKNMQLPKGERSHHKVPTAAGVFFIVDINRIKWFADSGRIECWADVIEHNVI